MPAGTDGARSVSRITVQLEVVGKATLACELVRHFAPTTSRAILANLPIRGLAHRYGDSFTYFETGLVIGSEKQKADFKRGDLGFMVSNGSICIFLKDTVGQPMNPIGRVSENLDLLESTKPGDVIELRKVTA
jgi:hypothetical protein